MHGHHAVGLAHRSGSDTTELLHVATDTKDETKVNAKRPDVGTGLARDVEDGEPTLVVKLDEVGRVDGPDPELTLDGRNERRALEERTREGLERPRKSLLVLERGVKPKDGDILLTGSLLRLDKPGRAVDADEKAASDLGVERSRVTGLLTTKDAAEPGDNFVRGRVRRLVEVDDSGPGEEGVRKERTETTRE